MQAGCFLPKYWLAAYKSASNLSMTSTMKLSISGNTIYADNLKVCFCEAGNERTSIPAGHYPVTIEFSHVHDLELPKADGIGWLGASHGCDIVLGDVVGRSGVIPSRNPLGRLLAMIQAKEDMGSSVTLEVACRTLSAKVLVLEAPGKRVPETRNTESIRYDRYGREERQTITKRGFNEPL